MTAGRVIDRGTCATCRHFANDAASLEAAVPLLRSMSSAYAAVRANDGLCAVHSRWLDARSVCGSYAARESHVVLGESRPAFMETGIRFPGSVP